MSELTMETIVNFAKGRGFVYPGSEIYGGLANTWDYGPLGVELKNNIRDVWWNHFVTKRFDMVGLDSSILMNPKVWEASGHVGGFSDPLVDCKNCKERFRGDKIIEDKYEKDLFKVIDEVFYKPRILDLNKFLDDTFPKGDDQKDELKAEIIEFARSHNVSINIDKGAEKTSTNASFISRVNILALGGECLNPTKSGKKATDIFQSELKALKNLDILRIIKVVLEENKIKCSSCGKCEWTDPKQFNLMFKTQQGVTDETSSDIYLRPETAQGIFVDFPHIARTSRKKIPFGVGQIGKAFRNEITPGNFIFRTREFEQMEIEYFVKPGTEGEWHKKWEEEMDKFLYKVLNIKNKDNVRLRWHEEDELSHYSSGTFDIEYKFPFGWSELWGCASRTDFDLKQHEKHSGKDMKYLDPETNEKYVPYVIEPTFGLTRTLLMVLCDAYEEESLEDGETRIVLKLDPKLSPYKVAILPLVKKLTPFAQELFEKLSGDFSVDFDEAGSIGKRYRRQDEIGTPYAITIDFDTTGTGDNVDPKLKGTVTVRERDSMKQERISIDKLSEFLKERLK